MKKFSTLLMVFVAALVMFGQGGDNGTVPAYNAGPPSKHTKLPPILPRELRLGESFQYAFQRHAYELASKIPEVIYQQPCYCYCDRIGHNSLHSCYETTHAANCAACLKELYYSYLQHKQGRSARQIRKGIIAREWMRINLETADSIN